MRWGQHLIVAAIVGILGIGVWEIFADVRVGDHIMAFFQKIEFFQGDVGLILASLIFIIIILWWKASRG